MSLIPTVKSLKDANARVPVDPDPENGVFATRSIVNISLPDSPPPPLPLGTRVRLQVKGVRDRIEAAGPDVDAGERLGIVDELAKIVTILVGRVL
jgi:hypothetical protein